MGTMHRIFDRPLVIPFPSTRSVARPATSIRTTARLVFATAFVAIIGGACFGFIVGYAVATAVQVGP